MNRVVGGPWPVAPRAAALHATLTIADMHADTLLWQRDLTTRDARACRPAAARGGQCRAQVFSSVTKTPKGQNYQSNSDDTDNITLLAIAQLQPVRTWGSLLERSLWHAEKLRRARPQAVASDHRARPRPAARRPNLRGGGCAGRASGKLRHDRRLAVGRGAARSRGQVRRISTMLYAAGFRMGGLAHFFDNELAGSMHGVQEGRPDPFGAQGGRRDGGARHDRRRRTLQPRDDRRRDRDRERRRSSSATAASRRRATPTAT